MDKVEIINKAIRNKKLISFWYDGGLRIVEPFLTGIHYTTGNISLRAWWVKGFSKSNKVNPNWRLFTIENMIQVQILDESFLGRRQYYNPRDTQMSRILERV